MAAEMSPSKRALKGLGDMPLPADVSPVARSFDATLRRFLEAQAAFDARSRLGTPPPLRLPITPPPPRSSASGEAARHRLPPSPETSHSPYNPAPACREAAARRKEPPQQRAAEDLTPRSKGLRRRQKTLIPCSRGPSSYRASSSLGDLFKRFGLSGEGPWHVLIDDPRTHRPRTVIVGRDLPPRTPENAARREEALYRELMAFF